MENKIFNNTKRAFALKSDKELKKAIFVFKMMSRPILVSIGTWLTNVTLMLRLPVEGIIKSTIFEMFCGGESQKECMPVVKKMYEMNAYTVFDYAVEGNETKEQFQESLQNNLEIIKFASEHKEIPFTVFKPTGMGKFDIWEKVSAGENLTSEEQNDWKDILNRVEKLCKQAYDKDVRLLMDAEESWIQTAADELIEEMMSKYNRDKPIIYTTVQCYRWDRLQHIKDLHQRGKNKGFKIGVKIVRGAYMEKENARAQKRGYPTPICEDKEATDVNYNTVLNYTLQHLNDISIYIGTHNEVSSYLAMQIIDEKGLAKDDDRIWFSQLYGMSNHITFNLSLNGYNSAKFTPFGKVRDVIPYLIRRARENSSVKGQTGRELALLREEKKRREGTYVKRIH